MSKLLVWKSEYQLGIPSIDTQHQHLFEIVIRFQHCIANRTESPQHIQNVINELINYTEYHFQHEENLLKQAQYPFLEEHEGRHEEFSKLMGEILIDYQEGKLVRNKLQMVLNAWWIEHILVEDRSYAAHVRKYLNSTVLTG